MTTSAAGDDPGCQQADDRDHSSTPGHDRGCMMLSTSCRSNDALTFAVLLATVNSTGVMAEYKVGTCEALRFDSNSNRTSQFDSKVTGRFENFESPRLPRLPSYHKQHSTTNFNRFGIAIGIYIEFN